MKTIKSPFLYTSTSIIGSLLPLIFAFAVMAIFESEILSPLDLTGKGEITIICIPLIVSVIIALYNNKQSIGFSSWYDTVFTLSLFLLVISVGFYGFGYKRLVDPIENLMYYSIGFLIWTFFALYITKYQEENAPSLKGARKKTQDDLEEKFEKENEEQE